MTRVRLLDPPNNFHPHSHRLHTLGARSARHAELPSAARPCYQPVFRNPLVPGGNRRPQQQRTSFAPSALPYPLSAPPGYPVHPFNLGNVLHGIQQRNAQHDGQQPRRLFVPTSRRAGSNVSSQSSNGGGVDVHSQESGSSGSSHTVRADGSGSGCRRRRFDEIEDGDEY